MKIKYLLLVLLMSTALRTMAQPDSTAFELQRNKVNALLAQRSAKFGQYQQSLNSRTGIFGMQTKKDIKNSNEILRQITLNDNKIFREIKVLMEYKEMQVQQVQRTATANNDRIQRYMLAIKKLQEKNQELKIRAEQAEQSTQNQKFTYYAIAGVFLICIIIIIVQSRKIARLTKTVRH
jgi:hypothetical protein